MQADQVKAQLFTMANRGVKKAGGDTPFSDSAEAIKKGSITDSDMKQLIEGASQALTSTCFTPLHASHSCHLPTDLLAHRALPIR